MGTGIFTVGGNAAISKGGGREILLVISGNWPDGPLGLNVLSFTYPFTNSTSQILLVMSGLDNCIIS